MYVKQHSCELLFYNVELWSDGILFDYYAGILFNYYLHLQNYDILLKYREEPFPIVLHSCKSGQGGDNSFAAKLSSIIAQKIPQVAVIASPELVLCEMDNKGNYNEYVSDRSGSKHGNWLVFQNGKQTMQGTPDYKSTVNKIISNKK